jgi:NAD(P)-dependent dehydrogenase (short-subunit alcohol dehydrogenase family)
MTGRFAGKVALVTGAGSGIGAAVTRRLAAEGAEAIVAADVDPASAEAVAAELPATRAVAIDVADAGRVDRVIEDVVAEHGRLDVVVHAAGVDDPAAKQRIADALVSGEPVDVTRHLDDGAWRRVFAVNTDGTFHVLRAAVRAMLPRRAGAIVTVGSSSAFDAPTGYPHYAASKAAVHALSQGVAKEVVVHGIRVNVVAPGPTATGMAARSPQAVKDALTAADALPMATSDEMAGVALFLASDDAASIAGAVLLANGGRFTVA